MSHIRLRQIARLERLYRPYLKRRRESDAQLEKLCRENAFICVANLSVLILYGNPKIDEPLLSAWQRCLESAAWQACREKHGGFDEYGGERGSPFDDLGATFIAKYFRKYMLPDLPGDDEIEKFNAIFEIAPPWLIWFSHGDLGAGILGVKLPDLSSVNRLIRGTPEWRRLPDGPFECRPLPDGANDESDSTRKKFEDELAHMTPRERKRTLRIYESYE